MYIDHDINLIVGMYVDDFLIFYKDEEVSKKLKILNENFKMKYMGKIQCCLFMRMTHNGNSIDLDQECYTRKILHCFGMSNCNRHTKGHTSEVIRNRDKGE